MAGGGAAADVAFDDLAATTGQDVLYLFDPSVDIHRLRAGLDKGQGWQPFIKRGLHTFRQAQFQLVLVFHEPLIPRREADRWKELQSVRLSGPSP